MSWCKSCHDTFINSNNEICHYCKKEEETKSIDSDNFKFAYSKTFWNTNIGLLLEYFNQTNKKSWKLNGCLTSIKKLIELKQYGIMRLKLIEGNELFTYNYIKDLIPIFVAQKKSEGLIALLQFTVDPWNIEYDILFNLPENGCEVAAVFGLEYVKYISGEKIINNYWSRFKL
jgi:hypothetical protein